MNSFPHCYIQYIAFTSRPRMRCSHLVSNSFSVSKITLNPSLIAVTFNYCAFASETRPSHESLSYSVPVAVHPQSSYYEGIVASFFFLKHQQLLASTEGKRSADLSFLLHRENGLFSPPLPPVFSICSPGVHAEDGGWIWVDKVPFTGMRPGKMPPLTYS